MNASQSLHGVKVLDITHYIAGPYCTKLFADYGAEVIKIERPGQGDESRRLGPFPDDRPDPEKSGLFLHLNTNKKGITLNLKTDLGVKICKELVKWADILVESFEPRVMPSLGLNYETLHKINPRLVMTSISNFGQSGPYRDYKASEIVLYGMGGAMCSTGLPNRPLKLAGSMIQYQAGTFASVPTMGALLASKIQGIGQHVDISIMESQLGSVDRRAQNILSFAYSGETAFFRSTRLGFLILPHGRYPCKDGFIEYAGAEPIFWPRWVKMLEMPELLNDPRFKDLTDLTYKDEFEAIFLPWLIERSKQEAMEKAQNEGVPGAALKTTEDVFKDPHLEERGYFVEIDRPVSGKIKYTGAPFKMEKTPWKIRRPAPLLGQHNEEVYNGLLGYTKQEIKTLYSIGVI
ncbi:MAG: CoA transferase [Thermodesulfobacteriota bacterium]|nr:CoA transferase [Thermodesulfobacteriota bacterium]